MDTPQTPRSVRFTRNGSTATAEASKPSNSSDSRKPIVIPKFVRGFRDHAFPILQGEPTINDDQRKEIWDLYHGSKNTTELARRLNPMPLHPDLKRDLLRAKNKPAAEPSSLDHAMQAIHHVSKLDRKVLEIAEAHPNVLRLLTAESK